MLLFGLQTEYGGFGFIVIRSPYTPYISYGGLVFFDNLLLPVLGFLR